MSDPYDPSRSGYNILNPGGERPGTISGSDISRVLPRQLSTGSLRGTQTVGYGNVKIDGSNNRIDMADGTGNNMTIGSYSNTVTSSGITSVSTGFGLSVVDSDGSFITLGINKTNSATEMLFNDGITNRLLIGKNNSGDEVVWISRTGVNVTTASLDQLIFNSNQNIFKIVSKVSTTLAPFSVTSSGPSRYDQASSSVTYNHNLGYTPVAIVYENSSGSILAAPFTQFFTGGAGAGGWATTRYGVDSTSISIEVQLMVGSTPAAGLTVNYTGAVYTIYLLQETAT